MLTAEKPFPKSFPLKKNLLIYSLCIQSGIAVFLHAGLLNTSRCSVDYLIEVLGAQADVFHIPKG